MLQKGPRWKYSHDNPRRWQPGLCTHDVRVTVNAAVDRSNDVIHLKHAITRHRHVGHHRDMVLKLWCNAMPRPA